MTPEERQLLTALVERIKTAPVPAQKDAEAESMIRDMLGSRPDAPYLLAQTVLIQDFSLDTAKAQIADLQRQLAEARNTGTGGSFLPARGTVPDTGASPWRRPAGQSSGYAQPQPAYAPSPYAQPSYPPTYPPQGYQPYGGPIPGAPVMQQAQTSSFLRDAAVTAAGVAGGALLFQGISSMFGGHGGGFGGGGFGGAGFEPGFSGQPSLTEITNNYYLTEPAGGGQAGPWQPGGAGAAGYMPDAQAPDPIVDAGFDDPGFDDAGFTDDDSI